MKQHIISATTAAIVAAIATFATARMVPPQKVVVAPIGTYSAKSDARRAMANWGELTQPEIDSLTASLKKISKTPTVILCKDDEKCGDIALDFDNAFESAHWETTLDAPAPLGIEFQGIGASSPEVLKAINDATGGRLSVRYVKSQEHEKDILVIGAKPKN